jgi:cytochrome c peroxidase
VVRVSLYRDGACWVAALLVAIAAPAVAAGAAHEMPVEVRTQLLQHGPWPVAVGRDASNRVSGHPAAVEFGYRMFREPRMSTNNYVACISCHQTDRAFTDAIARAQGQAPVGRNTPTLANLRLMHWYGWGGTSDSLWMASLRPMLDAREFGSDAARVAHVVRVGDGLACRYRSSFGALPTAHADERVMVNVAKAIAAFVETLTTGPTRFDEFRDALARGDAAAVASYPSAARRGAELFVGKAQCATCHAGPNFSDGAFHSAEPRSAGFAGAPDAGREAGLAEWRRSPYNRFSRFSDLKPRPLAAPASTMGDTATRGQFRTPSLRNVAVTAPYMYDGSVDTLFEAVGHPARTRSASEDDAPDAPRPAALSAQETLDLVAFLETLTDAQAAARRFPPMLASTCPRAGEPAPPAGKATGG